MKRALAIAVFVLLVVAVHYVSLEIAAQVAARTGPSADLAYDEGRYRAASTTISVLLAPAYLPNAAFSALTGHPLGFSPAALFAGLCWAAIVYGLYWLLWGRRHRRHA